MNRRLFGCLSARLPEVGLDEIVDNRDRRGRRWTLPAMLTAVVSGMVAGCQSLAEVEALTEEMALAARWRLGLKRRTPDTTLRDALVTIEPEELRKALHRQVRAAHRRKALEPVGLPFGVVAMDGKVTLAQELDGTYAQLQPHSEGQKAIAVVRTVTCSLVSSAARVCIDAVPIPAVTNEMGWFQQSLSELVAAYSKGLFRLVTYDAGACSKENAKAVVAHGLDYLFTLNASQRTLTGEAQALLGSLGPKEALASTEDVLKPNKVVRRAWITEELAEYPEWDHLKTVVRVQSQKYDSAGKLLETEDRYFGSSCAREKLTPAQWLFLVRSHWGVENNCHHTFDAVFREDDRPWIEGNVQGLLAVQLLRRISYNIASLFRSVTQRSDERRRMPWRDLLRGIYNALIAATENQLAALRPRVLATP